MTPLSVVHACAGHVSNALQAALSNLSDDAVTNIAELAVVQSALQSSSHALQHLPALAKHLACVLPSTVTADSQGTLHIKQAQLQDMITKCSHHGQTGALSTEESRAGLAVLLVGLWCHQLKQDLDSQSGKPMSTTAGGNNEAAVAASHESSLPSDAAAVDCVFTSASLASVTIPQSTEAMTDHGDVAASSAAFAADGVAAEALARAASAQAISGWADQVSLVASDVEEEELEDCASVFDSKPSHISGQVILTCSV